VFAFLLEKTSTKTFGKNGKFLEFQKHQKHLNPPPPPSTAKGSSRQRGNPICSDVLCKPMSIFCSNFAISGVIHLF